MADIECVFESMTGTGSIYISNFIAAQDLHILKKREIKAILSVARSGLLHHPKEDIPHYLYIPAQDHEEYHLYKHFNETYQFIDQARKQTNVLIHCMVGVSRSVTVVIAYLLKKFKCSLREVILMLQRKRNKINPNKGFIEQLKKYTQQEGLKCDFQGIQMPNFKDRAKSAQKNSINYSNSPENMNNFYKFSNPIKSREYKIKEEFIKTSEIRNEKTTTTKKDQLNNLKKSEELKIQVSIYNLQNSQNSQEKFNSEMLPCKNVVLKKGFSLDNRKPKIQIISQQNKISIQEKISRVRQKLFKKQEQQKKNLSIQKMSKKPNKQNNMQQSSNTKSQKKKVDYYLLLYSQTDPLPKQLSEKKQKQQNCFLMKKKDEQPIKIVKGDSKMKNEKQVPQKQIVLKKI